MQNSYVVASPSLEGILTHESLRYDGISRPLEVLRAFDRASHDPEAVVYPHQEKLLERYFFDLYGVFMKKMSEFVIEPESDDEKSLKLQAMLQEMVKVKKLLC